MSFDGAHRADELAEISGAGASDFLKAIEGFSRNDLVVVARFLEQVRFIADDRGPEAAIATIDRVCACGSVCNNAATPEDIEKIIRFWPRPFALHN